MRDLRPLVPVSEEGLDEIARSLLTETPPERSVITSSNIEYPENYIILEGKSHGDNSYSDLLVCMYRLGYNHDVETISKNLSLTLKNTAKEQNGHDYTGSINWQQALKLNLGLGNITLNPRQYLDFRQLLQDGIEDKVNVYNGKGSKINTNLLKQVYDEISEKRDPWRGEWLDAHFEEVNGVLHLRTEHKLDNGILKSQYIKPLESYIRENCYVDLDSFNKQGLPTGKSRKQQYRQGENIKFWCPRKDNVAWFYSGSGGADLYCDWDPELSDASLGVRVAKIFTA